jgi:DNA-binding FadR family transcriptional regulator
MIAAIRAREPDQAERIARDHMRRSMEIRIQLESYQAPSRDGSP